MRPSFPHVCEEVTLPSSGLTARKGTPYMGGTTQLNCLFVRVAMVGPDGQGPFLLPKLVFFPQRLLMFPGWRALIQLDLLV